MPSPRLCPGSIARPPSADRVAFGRPLATDIVDTFFPWGLAASVLLLWLRHLRLLYLRKDVGPLVYVIRKQVSSIRAWGIVVVFFFLAWSAAFTTLFASHSATSQPYTFNAFRDDWYCDMSACRLARIRRPLASAAEQRGRRSAPRLRSRNAVQQLFVGQPRALRRGAHGRHATALHAPVGAPDRWPDAHVLLPRAPPLRPSAAPRLCRLPPTRRLSPAIRQVVLIIVMLNLLIAMLTQKYEDVFRSAEDQLWKATTLYTAFDGLERPRRRLGLA